MIAGSFFFAVAGKEIFYCRAITQTSQGLQAFCLNHAFYSRVDDDGYLLLPHTGQRARVELVTSNFPPKFNPRDHAEAIAYFLKRRAVKSEGIAS